MTVGVTLSGCCVPELLATFVIRAPPVLADPKRGIGQQ